MSIFRMFFRQKQEWTELETLYSAEHMERICRCLSDHNIPCKIRAALLPVPLNTAAPLGTMTQSLWYLSVRPEDASRVYRLLRQERR